MFIGLFTAVMFLGGALAIYIFGKWLYDNGKSHGASERDRWHALREQDLRRLNTDDMSRLQIAHADDIKSLMEQHEADVKRHAADFEATRNVLIDQHEQELVDLRQRCVEYLASRIRLDGEHGVELSACTVALDINHVPLRVNRQCQ